MFDVQFVAKTRYTVGEHVMATLRLQNTTGQDVSVFKWFTPLEGLWSDCLVVERDGEALPYVGPTVKRGDPMPEDYQVVRAGEISETLVDVSRGYDTSRSGSYVARLNCVLEFYVLPAARVALPEVPRRTRGLRQDLTERAAFEVDAG